MEKIEKVICKQLELDMSIPRETKSKRSKANENNQNNSCNTGVNKQSIKDGSKENADQ